jgi:hypothetical protein
MSPSARRIARGDHDGVWHGLFVWLVHTFDPEPGVKEGVDEGG